MSDSDLTFDDLLATFNADAADDIAALESGLLALERTPDDVEIRRELLRRAHTLKGNAAIVGMQALSDFAHTYEERLEQLDVIDESAIASLLAGVDTFERLLLESAQESEEPRNPRNPRSSGSDIRVGAEKLNRMLDLAGEIAIARGRVTQLLAGRDAVAFDALIEIERQIDQLQAELQELIMRARMVPVGSMFRRYARTVHDTAALHGKNARLITIGEEVEIDTTAVELLRDPITHMIRNAIDHGIERSSERAAKGKPPIGRVTLGARHEAGAIVISISDDGAGLDRRAIVARARVLGLETDRLADIELLRLIFEPGFTTSDEVTDLSGRGVGMDVVLRAVESLRGTIAIETTEGAGTTFTIRLPLTLAVIDGFAVAAGGETWIVPMDNVVECVELPSGEAADATTGVLLIRGEIVPYVRVRKLFGGAAAASRENVLIVDHAGARAGLVVDELFGASQAVIKPLGDYFAAVEGIAGSSILANGRVALILDTATILRNLESQKQEHA